MSAVVAAAPVSDLYGRYKQLALAAGAALVLDAPLETLHDDVDELVADARAALAAGGAHESQLRACVDAAEQLQDLVRCGGDVESVRRSHRHLRREVWKVIPCEYVPCCASAGGGRE
jgi:hypothetical protein